MIVSSLSVAATHPRLAAYRLRRRLRPDGLFRRYGRLARRAGLDRVWLILSFDCDTPEDAEVALAVHERLLAIGIRPVYAVPGDLLRTAAETYGRIAATGAEFINHGDRMHTAIDPDTERWTSTFFYDQQSREALLRDIVDGDRTIEEVLGRRPAGFRTPHFGTFQQPEQLRWLHGELRGLGYGFSTSTVPLWGFRHGPAFDRFGCVELPVSGGVEDPLSILDTWSCFEAPDRVRSPADYEDEAVRLAAAYENAGAGIINLYGDPSHVHDSPEFFRAIEGLAAVAQPTGYDELLRRMQ